MEPISGITPEQNKFSWQALLYIIGGGVSFLIFSMTLMAIIMSTHGTLPRWIAFPGKIFGPIWMAAGIGWVVAYSGKVAEYKNRALQIAVAVLLSVPVVITEPWTITALGMGDAVSPVIKIFMFLLPLAVGAKFAYQGSGVSGQWSGIREGYVILFNVFLLVLLSLAVYTLIYIIILPNYPYPIDMPR